MRTNNTWSSRFLAAGWFWVLASGLACTAEIGFLDTMVDGQGCVGNPGVPGRCEGASQCRIGGGGCEEGYVCRGDEATQLGGLGNCQPECRVGSNNGCSQGHVCMGFAGAKFQDPGSCQMSCTLGNDSECPQGHVCLEVGRTGICQMPPQCFVGDNSTCGLWQNCEGIFENKTGAAGRCKGDPPCRVGDATCPAWQSCVGYESNANDAPGHCQGEPECRVGDNSNCEAWQNCVGYESHANNAPGHCQGEPECFVGNDNMCSGNTPYCIGYGSNEDGTPGHCDAESQCRVGSPWTCPENTTCVIDPPNIARWNDPGSCRVTETSARPWDITQRYMFFGHNSVGGNIVAGIGSVTNLRILSPGTGDVSNYGARHFNTTTNDHSTRRPALLNTAYGLYSSYDGAITSINRFVDQVHGIMNGTMNGNNFIPGQRLDIVFMKFCYVVYENITNAQVDLIFNHYATQMALLQTEFPELIIVHFTQTNRPCGNFQLIYDANARAMRYRQHILDTYGRTGRVFDLTLTEATNGQNVNYCPYTDSEGNPVLGMQQGYSVGGNDGHLNDTGRRAVGNALADFLARVR